MRTHVGVSMPLRALADIKTTWFLYVHLLLEDNYTDLYRMHHRFSYGDMLCDMHVYASLTSQITMCMYLNIDQNYRY